MEPLLSLLIKSQIQEMGAHICSFKVSSTSIAAIFFLVIFGSFLLFSTLKRNYDVAKLDILLQMMEAEWILRQFDAVWVLDFLTRNPHLQLEDVSPIQPFVESHSFLKVNLTHRLIAFQMEMDSRPARWDLELML